MDSLRISASKVCAQRRRSCIHQQHAIMPRVVSDLDGDVPERAGEHVYVALHVPNFILLSGNERSTKSEKQKRAEPHCFASAFFVCSCSN